jgi:hypothetical protein
LRLLGGAAVLLVALAAVLLGFDLQTYRRLSYEHPVAIILLNQTGDHSFDATLIEPPSSAQTIPLKGDEWRIEARVLKWKPWANVFGLDSRYRLTRLAGEYADAAAEQTAPRAVHDLGSAAIGGDLARVARSVRRIGLVDTLYGSAALMPMANGAEYQIWLTQSGLVVRPMNNAATKAVADWR